MQFIDGIPVCGSPVDEGALAQIKNCARTADQVALMADHHKGYAVPIGGVVAYEHSISPSGVGYDIACGNKAICTDADATEVRARIATIMDDVWKSISFGIGRKNAEPVDHALFDDATWSEPAVAPLKKMAANSSVQSDPAITTWTFSRMRPAGSGLECTSAREAWATRRRRTS